MAQKCTKKIPLSQPGESHMLQNNFQTNEGTSLFLQRHAVNHATVQF